MHILAKAGEKNPVQEDGSPFPYVLLSPDESVGVFADSLHDIVGYIVGNDYINIDDPARELVMRTDTATVFVANVSGRIYPALDTLLERGVDDEDLLGFYMTRPDFDDDITGPSIDPMFSKVYFEGLDNGREWDYEFPFIGLSTDYLPHTPTPPMTGNVVLVDPMDERVFVDSLLLLNDVLADAGQPPLVRLFISDGN